MISFENISVSYTGKRVVDGVTGGAKSGEFIALVGPNGSGKSTLLKAVAGLIKHEGTTSLPRNPRVRAKEISYLAQQNSAPKLRRVKDIIALGRTPYLGPLSKLSPDDELAIERAANICEIAELLNREFGTLSGGETMRVHLGRALATDAPILLADEPITALDPYYQISAMNILRQLANDGKVIIAALHDLDFAKRFADRIWVMNNGCLVENEPAEKALNAAILRDVFRITVNGEIVT